ncbi:MAG: tetratricopeptide repeat protein [Bacteroidota bacterium]|nr:tetratricopeptide repeat protein [Candidatus Kapabacteria bacterium]MDW8220002.1 tetratricopeptide repeat protein [Bacteroidota bacterium]
MQSRLEQLFELHREDPNDPFIRYAIALEYQSRQDYAQALAWYEELRRIAPDYVPTYYMLASVYRALHQLDAARAIYYHGIDAARQAGDTHALSELSAALEELDEGVE